MLEFLASFEDEETGWVDPQVLMDIEDWTDGDENDDTQEEYDDQ